jgi:hypothetical protein
MVQWKEEGELEGGGRAGRRRESWKEEGELEAILVSR